jgi:hypothetical protein
MILLESSFSGTHMRREAGNMTLWQSGGGMMDTGVGLQGRGCWNVTFRCIGKLQIAWISKLSNVFGCIGKLQIAWISKLSNVFRCIGKLQITLEFRCIGKLHGSGVRPGLDLAS